MTKAFRTRFRWYQVGAFNPEVMQAIRCRRRLPRFRGEGGAFYAVAQSALLQLYLSGAYLPDMLYHNHVIVSLRPIGVWFIYKEFL